MFGLSKLVQRSNNKALKSCDLSSLMHDRESSDFIKTRPNDVKTYGAEQPRSQGTLSSLRKRENPGNEVES